MPIDVILTWLAGTSHALYLLAHLQGRDVPGSLLFACLLAAVVAGAVIGATWAPWVAGVSLLVWGVGAPALILGFRHALVGHRWNRALGFARALAWLIPGDRRTQTVTFLEPFVQADGGDLSGAIDAFERLAARGGADSLLCRMEALQLRDDPATLLRLLDEAGRIDDPRLIHYIVPAYARVRDDAALGAFIARHEHRLMRRRSTVASHALMTAFAVAGRLDAVEQVLAAELNAVAEPIKAYWRAFAAWRAGGPEAAFRAAAEAAARDLPPGIMGYLMERRARDRQPRHSHLTAAGRAAIDRLADRAVRSLSYRAGNGAAWAVMTGTVAASLIAVEVARLAWVGPWTAGALRDWGAVFYPDLFATGEWWRLVTAAFLHFDAIHLAMNVLALAVLGPFVERQAGRTRFLAIYAGAMVLGEFAVFATLYALGDVTQVVMVGASVAVMGIAGAHLAIAAHGWVARRIDFARQDTAVLLALVAAQVIFDLVYLQNSVGLHLNGVIAGLFLGFVLVVAPRLGRVPAATGEACPR